MTKKIVFKITMSLALQTAYRECHLAGGKVSLRTKTRRFPSLMHTLEGEAYLNHC